VGLTTLVPTCRGTKHNPACRQAGIQDFFIFFIDLKNGTLPTTEVVLHTGHAAQTFADNLILSQIS